MIGIIWVIFILFDLIILSVVLMNFLIAIVFESYAEVMKNQKNNTYRFRAFLNQEYSRSSELVNKKYDSIFMAIREGDLKEANQDHM